MSRDKKEGSTDSSRTERERGKEARGEGSRTELVREKRHVRDAAALNSSVALSLNI